MTHQRIFSRAQPSRQTSAPSRQWDFAVTHGVCQTARAGKTKLRGSLQDCPQRVNQARNPEEEAQDQIDDRGLGGFGLEINREWRNEQRDDDENDFVIHATEINDDR
jgi:hypothetical protein